MLHVLPRRFHNSLTGNQRWIRERSHESYAKNYSVVFPFDEPLASRNMRRDPFHQVSLGICPEIQPNASFLHQSIKAAPQDQIADARLLRVG